MAEHEIRVFEDKQLTRITVRGILESETELDAIIGQVRSHKEAKFFPRLYDFRECVMRLSIVDLYQFPRHSRHMQSARSLCVRVALLANDNELFELFDFYETTARNAGFTIRAFTNEAEALVWISSSER